MLRRLAAPALAAALFGAAAAAPARASDSAALQFTVPAPDPVQAGETVALQALAVNTGGSAWAAGSYYWVGEVYDLDENLVGRTDQVSPPDAVAKGDVASISLPFHVPDTGTGRRLYRVLLVKDSQTLLSSPLKPFVIVEKAIPEPPKAVDYRVEGNVTVSYKNSSRNGWAQHQGATTLNTVGKVKESSYLLNAYLLHEPGQVVDPFIILFTYYAPWGTVYGGDISPSLGELSVYGQSARGAMLEQRKGSWEWSVLGGQTIESQPGTATTNGRFARSLYAGKVARRLPWNITTSLTYFLSADEAGSLSTDPKSSNFRGPTLVPQKNSGAGLGMLWEPRPKLKVMLDWQQNTHFADTAKQGAKDTAWKGEVRWERRLFKLKTYLKRAGTKFVSFASPSTVGDRFTQDLSLGLYPASWYTLSMAVNQYKDNLLNSAAKATTNQRTVSLGNAFQFKTGTNLNLNASVVTAKAQPSTVLDNQTTTLGVGGAQTLGRHSLSLNVQTSRFKDKNKLAHDLDTNTVSLSGTFALPRNMGAAFGVSQSSTKDKVDGSKRQSLSVSPSLSQRLSQSWTAQYWGTLSNTKNTSPLFPSDTQNTQLNTEFTWAQSAVANMTLGVGYNKNTDKLKPANKVSELLASLRYSYSF
jgi:hypothetical protein